MSRGGQTDYAGVVAVILAVTLGAVLVLSCFALIILDKPISDVGARLLTTIGAGLVGSLATYVGTSISRHRSHERDRDE
jgi:hypothetical protein